MAAAVASRRRTSGIHHHIHNPNVIGSSSPDDVSHLSAMLTASTQASPPRPMAASLINTMVPAATNTSAAARGFYTSRAISPVFAAAADPAHMTFQSSSPPNNANGSLSNGVNPTPIESMPRWAPPSFRQSSSGSSSPIFSAQMFQSSHSHGGASSAGGLAINPGMTTHGMDSFVAPVRPFTTAAIHGNSRRGSQRVSQMHNSNEQQLRRRSNRPRHSGGTGGSEWLMNDGYGSGSDGDGEFGSAGHLMVGSASSASSAGMSPVPPNNNNNNNNNGTAGSVFFPGLRPFDDTAHHGGALLASSPRSLRSSPGTNTRTVVGSASASTSAMISGIAHGANGIVINRGYSTSPLNGNTRASSDGQIIESLRCVHCGASHQCHMINPHHHASSVMTPMSPSPPSREPWQRILYARQPYPDNYCDESFLNYLQPNANLRPQHFWALVKDTASITQRISIIALFITVFAHITDGSITIPTLIVLDVSLMGMASALLFGLARHRSGNWTHQLHQFIEHSTTSSRRLLLFAGTLLGLSPVLKTLTLAYSSDTIWALTFIFCAIHLVMHDYSFINSPNKADRDFQGTISLNAGIFASLLLASRLGSNLAVFAFLLFAFEVFAGFPILAHHIRRYSFDAHLLTTILLGCVTLYVLYHINKLLSLVYICGVIFISFVCPFWLKWIQRYKNEIQGPWDYDDRAELESENM